MKNYIDAATTCFLISITDFYELLQYQAPADIETSISQVIITSRFSDKLKELQDKDNEVILSNLQNEIEKLIKYDVTEHHLNNANNIILNDNLTLTYRFKTSNILVLDLSN